MPFKSKSQQRFMFAAESRGDVPKGTAERWAHHTKDIKGLPEKVEKKAFYAQMAYDLGQLRARQTTKTAADPISIFRNLGPMSRMLLRYGAPAALGSYLAGPGYRGEGAALGAAAGGLGPRALEMLKSHRAAIAEAAAKGGAPAAAGAVGGAAAAPGMMGRMHPEDAALLSRLVAGGGAGYLGGRMLGAQNPYGMQPVFPGVGISNPMGVRPPDSM